MQTLNIYIKYLRIIYLNSSLRYLLYELINTAIASLQMAFHQIFYISDSLFCVNSGRNRICQKGSNTIKVNLNAHTYTFLYSSPPPPYPLPKARDANEVDFLVKH